MNTFYKQPSEVENISVDFVDRLGTGETIVSSTVIVYDSLGVDVTNTMKNNDSTSTTTVTAQIKAGTDKSKYKITYKIVSSSGTTYEEDVELIVYADVNLLSDLKTCLRISNTAYDEEIKDLIEASKLDLGLSGVLSEHIIDTDALIKRAIITYVKANFGWNNPDSARLQQSYEAIKNHISMSQDYAFFAITFIVKNSSAVVIDEVKIVFNSEEKYTNASGTAIFYVRAGNNYEYQITHEDYADYVDSDGDWYNVDVTASATINITMTAS